MMFPNHRDVHNILHHQYYLRKTSKIKVRNKLELYVYKPRYDQNRDIKRFKDILYPDFDSHTKNSQSKNVILLRTYYFYNFI